MHELAAKVDEYARGMIGPLGATLFEELGLYYIGPVDGHNIDDLISVLSQVATLDSTGPVLVHVITDEGLEATSQRARASEHQGSFACRIENLEQSFQVLFKLFFFEDVNLC